MHHALIYVLIFIGTYAYAGIYHATAILVGYATLQCAWQAYQHGLQRHHKLSYLSLLALGSLTLFLHNELFIKLKASLLFMGLGISLLSSHYGFTRSWLPPLVHAQLPLASEHDLRHLEWRLSLFYIGLSLGNLWVALSAHVETWMWFKFLGIPVAHVAFFSLCLRDLPTLSSKDGMQDADHNLEHNQHDHDPLKP